MRQSHQLPVPVLPLIGDIPQQCYPRPTPLHVSVATVKHPHENLVVVQVSSHTGVQFLFFDPRAAEEIGNNLIRYAREARSGIVISRAE